MNDLQKNPYNRQYSNVYCGRLSMLRDRCLSQVSAETKIVPRIIEITEEKASTIVGTIIKEVSNRPKEDTGTTSYHNPAGVDLKPTDEPFRHYCHWKDALFLEDESGRVELKFDSERKDEVLKLVTGVVTAVTGVMRKGIVHVEKIYFPEFASMEEEDVVMEQEVDDAHVLFVSGLDCGGCDENSIEGSSNSLRREMLIDYVTGHFPKAPDGSDTSCPSKICRVVVAGGGCAKPLLPKTSPYGDWNSSATKSERNKASKAMTESVLFPLQELDIFLAELCAAGVPVDYIPGMHDPTNANWPQKPIHECLLPHTERFLNMLNRSTNPYEAKFDGKVVLGSDGMNIADLRKFMAQRAKAVDGEVQEEKEDDIPLEAVTALQALNSSLNYNHMAPTAPDSLPSFPFADSDPFVITSAPHVYFAGNCDKFETKLCRHGTGKQTRLICIPSFMMTGQAVLLNLKTLKCSLVEFDEIVSE